MSRDIFLYVCLEDYCEATWDATRPASVCPQCGSPEIEVERVDTEDYDDFSGR